MFEGFETRADVPLRRRYAVSGVTALALVGLVGAWVGATRPSAEDARSVVRKSVDVRFRPPPPPSPPRPPPTHSAPPVAQVRPTPPKPAPKNKALEVVPAASGPAPLVAPTQAPSAPPAEAEASEAVAARHVAVGGSGDGRSAAGRGAPGPAPINLPENAVPPSPLDSNAAPQFPPEARSAGKEGMVILKIVVDAQGQVANVVRLKGDEPFVTAAMRAVTQWRFKPALVEGQPTAVYRIIRVPFRIRS